MVRVLVYRLSGREQGIFFKYRNKEDKKKIKIAQNEINAGVAPRN
jgi:hypothetical protein